MKTQTFLRSLFLFSIFLGSFFEAQSADILYWPQVDSDSKKILLINLSSEDQQVWAQLKSSTVLEEIPYTIAARSTMTVNENDLNLPTSETNPQRKIEYAWKVRSNSVLITKELSNNHWVKASPEVSPHVFYKIQNSAESVKIKIQNLNFGPQSVKVRFLNTQKKYLGESHISTEEYFVTSEHKIEIPESTAWLELIGQGRLHSRLWSPEQMTWMSSELPAPEKISVPESKTYFLLTNQNKTDSFIVALEDPNQIQKARDIIAHPENGMILFGRIRKDQLGWNRPLLNKIKTPFSWTVAEVTNFAQIGSITCDGSPSLVEEQLPQWLVQERICFWNYRVTRELTREQVQTGQLP